MKNLFYSFAFFAVLAGLTSCQPAFKLSLEPAQGDTVIYATKEGRLNLYTGDTSHSKIKGFLLKQVKK